MYDIEKNQAIVSDLFRALDSVNSAYSKTHGMNLEAKLRLTQLAHEIAGTMSPGGWTQYSAPAYIAIQPPGLGNTFMRQGPSESWIDTARRALGPDSRRCLRLMNDSVQAVRAAAQMLTVVGSYQSTWPELNELRHFAQKLQVEVGDQHQSSDSSPVLDPEKAQQSNELPFANTAHTAMPQCGHDSVNERSPSTTKLVRPPPGLNTLPGSFRYPASLPELDKEHDSIHESQLLPQTGKQQEVTSELEALRQNRRNAVLFEDIGDNDTLVEFGRKTPTQTSLSTDDQKRTLGYGNATWAAVAKRGHSNRPVPASEISELRPLSGGAFAEEAAANDDAGEWTTVVPKAKKHAKTEEMPFYAPNNVQRSRQQPYYVCIQGLRANVTASEVTEYVETGPIVSIELALNDGIEATILFLHEKDAIAFFEANRQQASSCGENFFGPGVAIKYAGPYTGDTTDLRGMTVPLETRGGSQFQFERRRLTIAGSNLGLRAERLHLTLTEHCDVPREEIVDLHVFNSNNATVIFSNVFAARKVKKSLSGNKRHELGGAAIAYAHDPCEKKLEFLALEQEKRKSYEQKKQHELKEVRRACKDATAFRRRR